MNLKCSHWFPSPIWQTDLDDIDNNAIKEYAQDLKKQDEGIRASNVLGWQSKGLAQGDCEALDHLINRLTYVVNECAKQGGLPSLTIQNAWININTPGSSNHLHNHPGAILSGCYYVDANKDQGNIHFERCDGGEYFLPSVEEANTFNSTSCLYASDTGIAYIFPGWLKHSVQPNRTDKDRISIAFNYGAL
mgnify:CR=1 FL=1